MDFPRTSVILCISLAFLVNCHVLRTQYFIWMDEGFVFEALVENWESSTHVVAHRKTLLDCTFRYILFDIVLQSKP